MIIVKALKLSANPVKAIISLTCRQPTGRKQALSFRTTHGDLFQGHIVRSHSYITINLKGSNIRALQNKSDHIVVYPPTFLLAQFCIYLFISLWQKNRFLFVKLNIQKSGDKQDNSRSLV